MLLKRLLHLSDDRVCQDHGRHPVNIRQIKSEHGEIVHFLYRRRGEDDDMVAAMPSPLHRLEIIRLGSIDTAEPRTGTGDIHNNAGKFGPGHIGYPLLLEGNPRS